MEGANRVFSTIDGTDVVEDFAYHIVQGRVLLSCRDAEEQKQLGFITCMDYLEPLNSTGDLLGCAVLRWSTDDYISYINLKVVLDPNEPSAPGCDIVYF